MYSHWTNNDDVNSLWWEVYNNKFTWTLGGGSGGMYPFRLQGGGTGLIYNNTIVGFPSNYILVGEGRAEGQGKGATANCDGTHNWDGNADPSAPGWPCLSQTGRNGGKTIAQIQGGSKQASFPLYVWTIRTAGYVFEPCGGWSGLR